MRVTTRVAAVGVLTGSVLLLGGCTSAPPAGPDTTTKAHSTGAPVLIPVTATAGPAAGSGTRTAPAVTTIVSTITRHSGGGTVVASAPPKTPEPPPVDGQCPYLSADVVSLITGQHHGPTRLIATAPQPVCTFTRSDGNYLGSVRIIHARTAAEAVAAVNQHVPIADSEPASKPDGWTGGLMIKGDEATYGVSKGTVAVIAVENETPSIKARTMAICAIYGAKLQAGPAPDFCRPE